MRLFNGNPKASALEAEAARLRSGFNDLAARIAAKVKQDRALAEHLQQLERQAAEIEARQGEPKAAQSEPS